MILFRLLSAQPTTDGEKWRIKGAFHADEWYTDAYGQDPAPFLRKPSGLEVPQRLPTPWNPDAEAYLSYDAMYSGEPGTPMAATMRLTLDRTTYPARLIAGGVIPTNLQNSAVFAPRVPLEGTTTSPSGTFGVGTYYVAIAWDAVEGPVSSLVRVTVASGATNKLVISGIQWPDAAAPAVGVFVGTSMMDLRAAAFVGSSNDANGNPTTITISYWPFYGIGIPDLAFQRFAMQVTPIVHGGVWGAQVSSVSGFDVTIAGAGWTVNEWAGHTLSLYFRDQDVQPVINLDVLSNTADTLSLGHGSGVFAAGDVVVMRALSDHITSNTIGDDLFVNSFAPSGLATDGSEIGKIIRIISGTGAGQPGKTVLSNTSTVYTIHGTWDVTPDSTSVFIVTEPSGKIKTGRVITNDGSGGAAVVDCIDDQAPTSAAQSLLVEVATADIHGRYLPMRYQPMREVYLPSQNAARDGYAPLTASGGNLTINLDQHRNFRYVMDGSAVTILPPVSEGGIEAGDWFTLYLDQDSTPGRALPTFTGGSGGFVSNLASVLQVDPTANTRTSITLTYHGTRWGMDDYITGLAIT